MKVTAFVGGFGYPSSTQELATLITDELERQGDIDLTVVELREVAGYLSDATMLGFPDPALQEALDAVANADLLVAASAVFRGAYSGLFKAFFDLVDPVAMHGKPVILAATGGSARHQLVIDHSLRPLFSYFGSLIVPTAIYATVEDWLPGGQATRELAHRVERAASSAVMLASNDAHVPVS